VTTSVHQRADIDVADLLDRRMREVLHEIRQPLSAVFALAEMARSRPGVDDDLRDCLDHIIRLTQEVSGAAATLLAPADDQSPAGDTTDLDEVLDSVLEIVALTWGGTLVRRGQRGGQLVQGDRAVLRRGLVNLLDNAVRAAGPQGRVTVTVLHDADRVRVVVEDNGPGFGRMPSGSRLGLELTRRSLAAFGGELRTGLPSPAGGARVVLSVPLVGDDLPADLPGVLPAALPSTLPFTLPAAAV
jgi:signal transduction histidine kinase